MSLVKSHPTVFFLLFAAPLVILSEPVGAESSERMNVVFILIDDLGWKDLGCYGSSYYKTPNIDRLAREGMRFTDGYAACTVCSPTRAAILTGKYPARLLLTQWLPSGRWNRTKDRLREGRYISNLPLEEVTIAEALRESGYRTGFLGKWHLGTETYYYPEHQGFDVNIAGRDYGAPGSYFYPFEGSWRIPTTEKMLFKASPLAGNQGDYLVDRLAEEAEKFIRESASQPFFLMLSHYAVHAPLQGKAEKVTRYQEVPRDQRQGDVNLEPILTGTGGLDREAIYWHYPHYNQHPQSFPAGVIRVGDWKLIEEFETAKLSLFNLAQDLGETKNLVRELPEKAAELHNRLRLWRAKVGADPMRLNPEYLDSEKESVGMREINPPAAPNQPNTLALVGGRLIDGRGGPPVEEAVVIVRGSEIVAAGSRSEVAIPDGAQSFDVRGMSVLPGLIDSHFHSRNNVRTPIEYELKRGVTSFRDPGHPFRFYNAVMQSTEFMPRVFLCGAHLDAHPPVWPDQAVVIKDTDHVRATVQKHVDQGASAIKVYFRLPLEHIQATCQAAAERGVLVTAHLELVDADAAIRAGVRGIEHVTSFGTALAKPEAAEQFKSAISADSSARNEWRHRLWANLDLRDEAPRVKWLLETIIQYEVFVSPTLAIFERQAGKKNATEIQARGFENMLRFVGLCHQAGAKVVVGSHTSAPFAEQGCAYQRELELLVKAGMTPLESITAGTLHNAQFFGIDDRLGTVEAGKTADLVVVDGDPSWDITAINNVKMVMLNGNWVFNSAFSGSSARRRDPTTR